MSIMKSLNNGFEKYVRVREKQSRKTVHAYLATLDDASLNNLGFKRSELETGGVNRWYL